MMNTMLLNKEKKSIIPPTERRVDSTTPERVADEETRKFEETSKKLQELKDLLPKRKKSSPKKSTK